MRAIRHRDYESVEIVQCELFCCGIAGKLEAHAWSGDTRAGIGEEQYDALRRGLKGCSGLIW